MKKFLIVFLCILSLSLLIPLPVSAAASTMTATPRPTQLQSSNLDGSIVDLVLNGTSFRQGGALTPTNYKLNNAPAGAIISEVLPSGNTARALLILSFTGPNFSTDITNFSVTVLSGGTQSGETVTSNTMTIKAIRTLEGENSYIVTGTSNPSLIQPAGFNSRTNTLYLNYNLATTMSLGPTQKATFYYFIEVFDGNSNLLGNKGSYNSPLSASGNAGAQSLSIIGDSFTLTSLPAQVCYIVRVKSVSIN